MPYTCRLIEKPGVGDAEYYRRFRPGDMWMDPEMLERNTRSLESYGPILSSKYFATHAAKRPPIIVLLPNASHFCVDSRFVKDGEYYGDGWTVTGEAPLITLSPSINMVGSYHGFIRNGIVTDDVDGRAATHTARWASNAAE